MLDHNGVTVANICVLASSKETTSSVQSSLKECDEVQVLTLASAFRGRVWEISKHPYAYRVLLILILRGLEAVHWIFDEMRAGGLVAAAKHRFQCQVCRQVIECSPPSIVEVFVKDILEDQNEAINLCMHDFGNYVMKSVLQQGSVGQVQLLITLLIESCRRADRNNNGVAVLGCALGRESENLQKSRKMLALEILPSIVELALSRHGCEVVKMTIQILLVSCQSEAKKALVRLVASEEALTVNRFGRDVSVFSKTKLSMLGNVIDQPDDTDVNDFSLSHEANAQVHSRTSEHYATRR